MPIILKWRNQAWIWLPFMVIGPSLLYAGLATHAWMFIRKKTLPAVLTLLGSFGVGLGHFFSENRMVVVAFVFVFAIGLFLLSHKPLPKSKTKVDFS